MNEHMQRK